MKKLSIILVVLLLIGCSNRYQNPIESRNRISAGNDFSLDENYYVAMKIAEDVTGDEIEDEIYFIGYQENKEREDFISQNYYTNLYLLIFNGVDGSLQTVSTKYTEGLSPSLISEDFNSDGVKDIYISLGILPSGGSNRKLAYIISYKGNEVITLFDDNAVCDELGLDLSLKDEYFVEILCSKIDKTISFKLEGSICEWLEEEKIYSKGQVINQAIMTIDRFSDLEVIDINNDGIYELKGSQYLALMGHTVGLGFIKTILGYDVNEKEWRVINFDFETFW